jgi:hypothetical protein
MLHAYRKREIKAEIKALLRKGDLVEGRLETLSVAENE